MNRRPARPALDTCSNCGPRGQPVLDWAQGDCVCERCGLVLASSLIDETGEIAEIGEIPLERTRRGAPATVQLGLAVLSDLVVVSKV